MPELTSELIKLLGVILISAITILSVFVITYIAKLKKRAEIEVAKIEDEKLRELANNALNRIADLAVSIVDSFQQELVGMIKKGIEDGTHTKQELYDLRDQAVERVLSLITDEVREAAMYQIQDLKKYVEDLVSQEVLNLRMIEASNK